MTSPQIKKKIRTKNFKINLVFKSIKTVANKICKKDILAQQTISNPKLNPRLCINSISQREIKTKVNSNKTALKEIKLTLKLTETTKITLSKINKKQTMRDKTSHRVRI